MISTGDFIIRYYDKLGRKLDGKDVASSLLEANDTGDLMLEHRQAHSFTVDRRIFNSLENEEKWA